MYDSTEERYYSQKEYIRDFTINRKKLLKKKQNNK